MPRVHAFFDFDDTLLDGDSILYWLRYYYGQRPARRIFLPLNWLGLVLFLLRIVDSHALKRIFLYPMSFEDPARLDQLAADFVREDLAARFHAPVLRRLWTHHLLGHKVVIVSASATFYLRHLKTLLPMADIQGTEILWPPRGSLRLPRYADGNLRGANKIVRLKALGYDGAGALAFAYSDHHHDRFLFEFVEFPICVRPTRKLSRLAAERDWPVLDVPRKQPVWKTKLAKLLLLLFAIGPKNPAASGDAVREAASARDYAPEHCRALERRVAMKYDRAVQPEIFTLIFGSSGSSAPGRDRNPGNEPTRYAT